MFQFKTIEKRADPTDTYIKGFVSNVFKRASFDSGHEMRSSNDMTNSPKVTQAMYQTGFIYKNFQSPHCANHRISPEMLRTV